MSRNKIADIIAKVRTEVEGKQVSEPVKHSGGHSPNPQMAVIAKRDYTWNVDTFRYPFRNRLEAIFCAVEMTSRRAFVRLYGRSDPTAEGAVEGLEALKAKYKHINAIQADKGSEFNNEAVRHWCAANGVEDLYFTQPGVKQEASMVESFNSTLRTLLDNYVAHARKEKERSPNWKPILADIVEAYNGLKNRTTKMPPDSVTEDDMGLLRVILKSKSDKYLSALDKFMPGQAVRVWSAVDPRKSSAELSSELFKKGRKYWLPHIFTVVEQKGYKIVVKDDTQTYDRRLSPRDLLAVSAEEQVEAEAKGDSESEKEEAEVLEAQKAEEAHMKDTLTQMQKRERKAKKVFEPIIEIKKRQPRSVGKKPPKSRKPPIKTTTVLPQFYSVEAILDWEINDGKSEDPAVPDVEPFMEFLVKYAHRAEPEYQPARNFYFYDKDAGTWGWESHAYQFIDSHKDTGGKPLWWIVEEYVPQIN